MEYLGFWVTCDGVKPIDKNTEAIKNMNPPTSRKEVQHFIGVVYYYRGMGARCSHMLGSLTKISPNKVIFKWTKIELNYFREIKRIVACDTL